MNHKVDNPFRKVEKIIKKYPLGEIDAIIIDYHKEVTSS
jgi:calcineurin-like phosphoesterase